MNMGVGYFFFFVLFSLGIFFLLSHRYFIHEDKNENRSTYLTKKNFINQGKKLENISKVYQNAD